MIFSPLSSPRLSHLRQSTYGSTESISTQSGSYHLPSSAYTPNEASFKLEDVDMNDLYGKTKPTLGSQETAQSSTSN